MGLMGLRRWQWSLDSFPSSFAPNLKSSRGSSQNTNIACRERIDKHQGNMFRPRSVSCEGHEGTVWPSNRYSPSQSFSWILHCCRYQPSKCSLLQLCHMLILPSMMLTIFMLFEWTHVLHISIRLGNDKHTESMGLSKVHAHMRDQWNAMGVEIPGTFSVNLYPHLTFHQSRKIHKGNSLDWGDTWNIPQTDLHSCPVLHPLGAARSGKNALLELGCWGWGKEGILFW